MKHGKEFNRRNFMRQSAVGATTLAFSTPILQETAYASDTKSKYPLRLSACGGLLGQRKEGIQIFQNAYEIGLDGVSPSFYRDMTNPNSLRRKDTQIAYRDAALQYGIQINSIMAGGRIKSEPDSTVGLLDAIECARNLGARVILLALLYEGFPKTDEEYKRVIAVLKELALKAADEGVVFGLECSGSAEQQLRIIDGVNHSSVRIYYDFFNAMHFEYEPLKEIPILGDAICEFHVKNGQHYMSENIEGADNPEVPGKKYHDLNHPAIAREIEKLGYKGWLTLETSVLSGDRIADTKRNVEYIRKVYDIFG
jgi:sugar phosphate isomerase/epimerase